MKTIVKQNIYFKQIIGNQNINPNLKYRKMQYVICHEYKGIYMAYNLLTKQLITVNRREYDTLMQKCTDVSDNVKNLIETWFMVPLNHNDKLLYTQFFNLIPLFDNKKYLNHFLIALTSDCNARCFYCYEKGIKKITMSKETAIKAADYMIDNCNNEKVFIHWFGGEPLMNTDAMDIICNRLQEKNINYRSDIVSNGYLFDDKIVFKCNNLWNLKKAQITLDGTHDVYNKSKNYINPDRDPFEKVINNIALLDANNIDVAIRINIGTHNLNDIEKLIRFLFAEFKNSKNIQIYLAILYDILEKSPLEEKEILYRKIGELEQEIFEHGFSRYLLSDQLKISCCIADDPHGTTITPDGNLGRCEHFFFNDLWGSLYNDNLDFHIIEQWKEKFLMYDECNQCELLPYCIKLKKCPAANFDCNEHKMKFRMTNLKNAMVGEYLRNIGEIKTH